MYNWNQCDTKMARALNFHQFASSACNLCMFCNREFFALSWLKEYHTLKTIKNFKIKGKKQSFFQTGSILLCFHVTSFTWTWICRPILLNTKVLIAVFRKKSVKYMGISINCWISTNLHEFRIVVVLCLSNLFYDC